jgi:hypothetical protein
MSKNLKSGGEGEKDSVLGRLADSLKARLTGLNGVERSDITVGTISNRVPGGIGVLEGANDVRVEADEILASRIAEEAEETSIISDRVAVSNNVLDESKDSFISVDKLESGSDTLELTGPSIGGYSEGSAATVRELGDVSVSQGLVAFKGEGDSRTAATYEGDWNELDQQLRREALDGELNTENFSIGRAFTGNYSSANEVETSLNILKDLDERMNEEGLQLDENIAEASGNGIQKVRSELGKVLSSKTGLRQDEAAEVFGRGGNIFLQRSDEITSISSEEEELDVNLDGKALHGISGFQISVRSVESPEDYRSSAFSSAENGAISVDRIKSNTLLREASEVNLEASKIKSRDFGDRMSDSRIDSSFIEAEKVLGNAENVDLSAEEVKAKRLGCDAEGLEMRIGEVSGDTKVNVGVQMTRSLKPTP